MSEMQQDRIALDRGSVRTVDQDGHLHIALNPISKANVCPYYGSEIPDAEQLGLKSSQTYQLYRDPDELRKGADSFDGKPLLLTHKPQSAEEHSRQLTVGAIKNPKFEAPYLMAEIVVWDAEGIEVITSGEQKQLSCGYRYVAVMAPGEADGIRFDGRMTQIQGNHVALVETGRAGSDVVVGDSAIHQQPTETEPMTATTLPRSVRVAAIALDTYLRPKLIKDAKLDLGKLLTGMTGKAWATSKPQIKLGLDAALKDKLAKDANISDVDTLLNQLDDVVSDEDPMPKAAIDEDDDDGEEPKKKKEAEDSEEDDEDEDDDDAKKKKAEEAKDKAAKDKSAKDKTAKDKWAKDKQAKDGVMITQAAMDAALATQAKQTETATIARLTAIREAERVVLPWMPDLYKAAPQQSAHDVYRLALDSLEVDVKGVHPDALKPILMAQRKPGEKVEGYRPRLVAMDSASTESDYLKMFPNANRLMGA